ncbi:MAG: hypothetical protein JSU77_07495 [Fidelibacterota bacterium]|nr:MAG: hypothetical protein JSU77_07495 [Candidatus Neomarinimicrobiota bacterium]
MTQVARTLGLIFLLCSSAWSQDWQGAYEEMEREYEALRHDFNSLLATKDSLVLAVKAQQITIREAKTLIEDLTEYQAISKSLVGKYDKLVALSDSTNTLLKDNVELHKATAEEWEKLAVYLKDEYTKLVKKYSRRLWFRWELYAGLVAGLFVGIVI